MLPSPKIWQHHPPGSSSQKSQRHHQLPPFLTRYSPLHFDFLISASPHLPDSPCKASLLHSGSPENKNSLPSAQQPGATASAWNPSLLSKCTQSNQSPLAAQVSGAQQQCVVPLGHPSVGHPSPSQLLSVLKHTSSVPSQSLHTVSPNFSTRQIICIGTLPQHHHHLHICLPPQSSFVSLYC